MFLHQSFIHSGSKRTVASWRLDVLCLSLLWGDPMGLFTGAKVSSCLRSIMDFTITSREPMQGDQRLRGRLEESVAAWILDAQCIRVPCCELVREQIYSQTRQFAQMESRSAFGWKTSLRVEAVWSSFFRSSSVARTWFRMDFGKALYHF